jgi:3-dehydroquinate synthase
MVDLLMSDSLLIKSLFRNYEVNFIGDFTQPLKALVEQHTFFIIDAVVWEKYKEKLKSSIPEELLFIVEANEKNKSLDKCREIIEILVERKIRRNEKIVAIGGGVIQDITAFSASIIYRGIEWSFIPTTLLAQADSCIGSKTSINLGDKKNIVGNFYPPSEIYIDTTFLDTLSSDDIKSGIGEIMHYYIYAASPLFDEMIRNYEEIISDRTLLLKYIRESLNIKKSVIENDEFDRKERNSFNYGHTFGHAIESVTDYAIRHGQAVTVGMDMANFISMQMGLMRPDIFHNIHEKLLVNFPEYKWKGIDIDRYINLLSNDKKNIGSNVGCILANKPGFFFKQQLPVGNNFRKMIRSYFLEKSPGNE